MCLRDLTTRDTHTDGGIQLVTQLYRVYMRQSLSTKKEMIGSAGVEVEQVSQDVMEKEKKAH